MTVEVAVMLKYSDVLNGQERSPSNFYEQLSRCHGLKPINIVATINNRWILGEAAEDSWCAEFLSERIARKCGAFRVQMSEEGIVFTRAGALLNLKLMLALQPTGVKFKETAIGAVALHANDFVESPDTSSLAVGSLPVIAEFAPMWELQNLRNSWQLLLRSFYLYQLLEHNERIQKLFDTPIADIEFAGLHFAQYFSLLLGLYTNATSGAMAVPYPTSIINAADVAAKAHITEAKFETFVADKAFTFDQAAATFGPSDRRTFFEHVTSSAWTSDQREFRRRPLLRLPNGDFLVLDLQFLFENASSGLSWSLADAVIEGRRKQFLDMWGEPFEQYVRDLLEHYYPDQAPVSKTFAHDGQVDALIVEGDDIIVFEVKAGAIAQEVKGSRDPQVVDLALRKKFVTDAKEKRVGVRQLAATAKAVLAGRVTNVRVPQRVYPILVAEEPMVQTPGLNIYLDRIFREEVKDDRVGPLMVMLIDELEQVLPQIRGHDFIWRDLLAERLVDDRVVGVPVHTTLVELAVKRKFPRRPETFLAKQSEPMIRMIKNAYRDFDLK